MFAAAIVTLPALLFSVVTPQDDRRLLQQFSRAVDAYVVLQHDAAAMLPPAPRCGAEPIELTRTELANEIRVRRGAAREGSIFTADVAALFRARLDQALRDDESEAPDLVASRPDHHRHAPAIEINGAFPWEAGPPRWHALFWALPPLPEELEYRLAGADLVLLDVTANLVVDVLRDAVR